MKRFFCIILAALLIAAAIPAKTMQTYGEEQSFTLFEDFEGDVGTWQTVDADGDGKNWTLKEDSGYSYSGRRFVVSQSYINDVGELSPDNWLISPAFTPESDDYINWMIAAMDVNYQNDEYEVCVLGENYEDVADGIKIYSGYANGYSRMTPWAHIAVSLEDYAGQNIHIAFRHKSEGRYWVMLDYVYVAAEGVTPSPVCPIEDITVLNNYEADPDVIRVGEGFVTEVYLKPLGTDKSWVVYTSSNPAVASVDDDGYVRGISEGDAVITASTPDGTISDSYNIRVQGKSFYFEDFEHGKLHGDGGLGWKYRDADGDGYKWSIVDLRAEPYGYRCIYSASCEPLNPDNWLVSAEFTVPMGQKYELSWYDEIDGGADCRLSEHYAVYIAVNPSSVDDFSTKLFDGDTDGNYLRKVDISAYAGKTVRLAFRHYNSKGGSGLLIDRICAYTAEEVQPTPTPSSEPTPTPSSEPTPTPSSEPTPTPSSEPTPTPTTVPTTEPSVTLGDVNGDGKINTADAVLVLKNAANMVDFDETQEKAADVNHDGKVNTADAVLILKYAAGMISAF